MFLNKISKKEKTGIIIAMVVVSFSLMDRLIVNPVNNKIRQINREIKINEKKLIMGLRNLSQKEYIIEEYQKYGQYLKPMNSEEETIASVLREIESIAQHSNVKLVNMKPRSDKGKDFFKEYDVEVEAEGTLESFTDFLYYLNASSFLLRAQSLRFNLKEKDSSAINASILITKIP